MNFRYFDCSKTNDYAGFVRWYRAPEFASKSRVEYWSIHKRQWTKSNTYDCTRALFDAGAIEVFLGNCAELDTDLNQQQAQQVSECAKQQAPALGRYLLAPAPTLVVKTTCPICKQSLGSHDKLTAVFHPPTNSWQLIHLRPISDQYTQRAQYGTTPTGYFEWCSSFDYEVGVRNGNRLGVPEQYQWSEPPHCQVPALTPYPRYYKRFCREGVTDWYRIDSLGARPLNFRKSTGRWVKSCFQLTEQSLVADARFSRGTKEECDKYVSSWTTRYYSYAGYVVKIYYRVFSDGRFEVWDRKGGSDSYGWRVSRTLFKTSEALIESPKTTEIPKGALPECPMNWCEHIRRSKRYDFAYVRNNMPIPREWKFCPFCGMERPAKENVRAATLRFLMDNDQ